VSSRRRLAILDDFQGVALANGDWKKVAETFEIDVFRDWLPQGDERARRLAAYEVIVAMRERTPFPAALIEALPNLRLLVTAGMWNRSIDHEAAARRGITVCGTGSSAQAPVELTWALILAAARHIAAEDASVRQGKWQTRVGIELHGKTLAILGLGRLGRQVARIGQAFGMKVIAWSTNLTPERAAEAGAEYVSKEDLFRRADVLTLHVILGDRNRGIVGAGELALMKPTAILVNAARGPLVDEDALVAALESKRIACAALDVYDIEPLAPGHRLLKAPNTVLTPHVGITTDANYAVYYRDAAEDVMAWLAGAPVRVVDGKRPTTGVWATGKP
jgi:phosphoglycerate dehydrogenase-like enzyme